MAQLRHKTVEIVIPSEGKSGVYDLVVIASLVASRESSGSMNTNGERRVIAQERSCQVSRLAVPLTTR